MWPNQQFPADLVIFTEEILNGKFKFLCSASVCYRYWKWNHWMTNIKEKASINWHFTCQLARIYEDFKSDISEAYKVQVDCMKYSESDSYD